MEIIIAGVAFSDAYPIFTALPILTSAISLILMGFPLIDLMNELPKASKSDVRPIPRTTYSFPYCLSIPPLEFWLIPLHTSASSNMLTL